MSPLAGLYPRHRTLGAHLPGVDQRGAEVIVAEIGIDMARFCKPRPVWRHGPGVAPGNAESAGKQRSGKTRKGNRSLRAVLNPTRPRGGAHQGDKSLSALSSPWPHGVGSSGRSIAVAHSIMRSVFHMLSRNQPDRELGANYFDERRRHYTVARLARRIEHLGYHVSLELATTLAVLEIFKAIRRCPSRRSSRTTSVPSID